MGAVLTTSQVTFDRCPREQPRLAELWDKNTMMLLRWKPGEGRGGGGMQRAGLAGRQPGLAGETGLLWAAAEAMELDALTLKKQALHVR